MNWDAVAAIGELVGGVAVIVSLLYLARQIRHSNRIARGESQRATHDVYTFFSQILDEENRRIFVRGLSDYENLSLDERLCFTAIVHPLANQMQAIWLDWEHGLQLESVNDSWQRAMLSLLATKGGKKWWETSRLRFTHEYAEYINERLERESPPPMYDVFPEYGLPKDGR